MPTLTALSDGELQHLASSKDPTVSGLAAEALRYRQALRSVRGLLGIYNPNNVVAAFRLVREVVGDE